MKRDRDSRDSLSARVRASIHLSPRAVWLLRIALAIALGAAAQAGIKALLEL